MNFNDILSQPIPNDIADESYIVGCLQLGIDIPFIMRVFNKTQPEMFEILRHKENYLNSDSEKYALHFLYNYFDFNLNTEEIKEKYKLSNKFDLNIVNELRILKKENEQNKVISENQEDLKPKFEYKEELKEDPDLIEQTKKELKEENEKSKECEELINLAEEHLKNSESEDVNTIVDDNNVNADNNINNVNNEVIEIEETDKILSNETEYKNSDDFLNKNFTKIKDTELFLLCNLYKDKLIELNELRNKYNDVNNIIKYIKKELKEVLLIANECGIELNSELSIVDWDGTYKECLVSNDGDSIRVKFKSMINDISVNNNEIMIWIQIANKIDMLVEIFEKQCKEGIKNAVNNDDEILNILREYNEKAEIQK